MTGPDAATPDETARPFATAGWVAGQLGKLIGATLIVTAAFGQLEVALIGPLEFLASIAWFALSSYGLMFIGPAAHLALLRRWQSLPPRRFRAFAVATAPLAGLATVLHFVTYSGEVLVIPWLLSVVGYGAWAGRPPAPVRAPKAVFRDGKYQPFG